MKILFVCKYNAFRSKVAEAYFKKINRNKNIETASRGVIGGAYSNSAQRRIAKEILGIEMNQNPRQINLSDLKQADLIVVVASDIPRIIFDYNGNIFQKKITIWKIKDEQNGNAKNIRKIILAIKMKVDELNKKLEKTARCTPGRCKTPNYRIKGQK